MSEPRKAWLKKFDGLPKWRWRFSKRTDAWMREHGQIKRPSWFVRFKGRRLERNKKPTFVIQQNARRRKRDARNAMAKESRRRNRA